MEREEGKVQTRVKASRYAGFVFSLFITLSAAPVVCLCPVRATDHSPCPALCENDNQSQHGGKVLFGFSVNLILILSLSLYMYF